MAFGFGNDSRAEEEARSWKGIREIQALNEHSEFHPVVTKLTQQQIAEAENAFNRLAHIRPRFLPEALL